MKVLVTGGAGFICSHTVVELLNKGHNVVIVDNFVNSKEAVIERISKLTNKKFGLYKVDVCNQNEMDVIFSRTSVL